MTIHTSEIITSAVENLEMIAAEELSSARTESYAQDIEHAIRVVHDATNELLTLRRERDGLKARIESLGESIANLGTSLTRMREERNAVRLELEQVVGVA